MKFYKHFLRAVSAGITALAVAGMSPAVAEDGVADTLRINVFPGNIASIHAQIAKSKGIYAEEELSVDLISINSGPQANAALAGDSVDIVLNSPDVMVIFKERGLRPVAVIGATNTPTFVLIAHDLAKFPNAKKGYPAVMADFNNQTIASYGPSSSSERTVKLLLNSAGKALDSVRLMTAGGPGQSIAGLKTGRMDVVSDVYPTAITAELTGVGKVLIDCAVQACPASIKTPGAMGLYYYTTESVLKKKEKAIEAFVRAHQRVNAWMRDPANKEELRKELMKFLQAPPDIDPIKYFDLVADRAAKTFSVGVNPEALQVIQAALLSLGDIKKAVDLETMVWAKAPKGTD